MSCLYPRLNAALRNHDKDSLEPFLPYMKLLLSALYQLPLIRVPTYRGVKLEIFEVSGDKSSVYCCRAGFNVQGILLTKHNIRVAECELYQHYKGRPA